MFIYDISDADAGQEAGIADRPQYLQRDRLRSSGAAFYVSGGPSDVVLRRHPERRRNLGGTAPALPLGHNGAGLGLAVPARAPPVPINERVGLCTCAAGVAISSDGQTLVVANYYNDSITVFTGGLGKWAKWQGTRPAPRQERPVAGGRARAANIPFWVAVKGNGVERDGVCVQHSRPRDRGRESDGHAELFNPAGRPAVTARIPVKGQPNKMTLNAAQSLLYVVEDQSDTVDVIDTASNTILETIPVIGPACCLPRWRNTRARTPTA